MFAELVYKQKRQQSGLGSGAGSLASRGAESGAGNPEMQTIMHARARVAMVLKRIVIVIGNGWFSECAYDSVRICRTWDLERIASWLYRRFYRREDKGIPKSEIQGI